MPQKPPKICPIYPQTFPIHPKYALNTPKIYFKHAPNIAQLCSEYVPNYKFIIYTTTFNMIHKTQNIKFSIYYYWALRNIWHYMSVYDLRSSFLASKQFCQCKKKIIIWCKQLNCVASLAATHMNAQVCIQKNTQKSKN